jgi:hypothetical protein
VPGGLTPIIPHRSIAARVLLHGAVGPPKGRMGCIFLLQVATDRLFFPRDRE